MRIVFMGTPSFAAIILEDLLQHHEVVAVYSRPDAIRSRGKEKVASPVKEVALKEGITVHTPKSLRDENVIAQIEQYEPDAICVAAYGAILPVEVLRIPRFGCLNVHASLLPRWRGAAPIERAILAGDEEVGVCIMRMEEGLDTGDYCICRTAWVEQKNASDLADELAGLGSQALLTALVHVEQKAEEWMPQNDDEATYAPKIEKNELNPGLGDTASIALRKVRASSAAHPARLVVADRSVTVLELGDISNDEHAQDITQYVGIGQVIYREKRLFAGFNDGAVEILMLKPDGKQAMSAQAFAAGIQGIKDSTSTWEESQN